MENAQPEPSMEEILASIRRIISEDEEEKTPQARAPEPAARAAEPAPRPAAVRTERRPAPEPVEARPAPSRLSEDAAKPHLETEDVEMLKKNIASGIEDDSDGAILDRSAADAASNAFRSLSQSVRVSEGEGRTLEDLVVEMLRPMVKDWLDANLPAIVEEKVEEEVQRVARRR